MGTSTLTHSSGSLDLRGMERLVRVLSDLSGSGYEVILVTSGAIAVGTARWLCGAPPGAAVQAGGSSGGPMPHDAPL